MSERMNARTERGRESEGARERNRKKKKYDNQHQKLYVCGKFGQRPDIKVVVIKHHGNGKSMGIAMDD